MKLWILKKRDDVNPTPWKKYDTAEGFVIRAKTSTAARKIAHLNAGTENDGIEGVSPWLDKKYSTCERLREDGQEGVILMDYLQG